MVRRPHLVPLPGRHVAGGPIGPRLGTPPLLYHGGPVQHDPAVFLVFWGSAWGADLSGSRQALSALFTALPGSGYNAILSQYGDSYGPIDNDPALMGVWNDPSDPTGALDQSAVDAEVLHAQKSAGFPTVGDAQYMIFTSQGTAIAGTGFCGWHSYDVAGNVFSLIPYAGDADCIGYSPSGQVREAMTTIASHEYFESATDPYEDAWYTTDGYEVGDLCAYPGIDVGIGVAQYQWSNDAAECATSHALPPPAATSTSLLSSAVTVHPGAAVTLTALLFPPTTAGTVGFLDGATTIATATLTDGVATATVQLSPGQHALTAVYAGDAVDTGSRSAPVTVTAVATGGYTLDAYGGVHPYGGAPEVPVTSYWPGWDIARGIAAQPGASAGYVLDGWGGVHPFGGAPQEPVTSYFAGWDIARGIALDACDPSGDSGWVLDGWGGLHPFGSAPEVTPGGYWPGWDIARAITSVCTGGLPGGYVLDGYGGVHSFGAASPVPVTTYFGWDIARGIVATGNGAGYVLDGWGGVSPFGSAQATSVSAYWAGQDLAAGIAAGAAGIYVADRYGEIHAVGAAPVVTPSAAWPGVALVRGIV